MIDIKIFSLLVSLNLLVTACDSNQHKKPDLSGQKSGQPNPANAVSDEKISKADGSQAHEGPFQCYDAVKSVLTQWNQAISKHETASLEKLYAEEVFYYLNLQTKQNCIYQKAKWLEKHPTYQQEIKNVELYYLETDAPADTLFADFDKVCKDGGKETVVRSSLQFVRMGENDWKIIEESDLVTDLKRARQAKISTLKNGTYTFQREYWQDTRDIPQFAHDQVPYRHTLILNVGDQITGTYDAYSGTMRSSMLYYVAAGRIENGILHLTMIYDPYEEITPENYVKEEYSGKEEQYLFKIINGKALICLDKEKSDIGGKRFQNVGALK